MLASFPAAEAVGCQHRPEQRRDQSWADLNPQAYSWRTVLQRARLPHLAKDIPRRSLVFLGVEVKDLRITLVELPATVDGRLEGRPAKDIYSLLRLPARGVPLLEAICRKAGYADTVTLDPQYNRVAGRLDVDDWRRLAETDVLGLSIITRTANQIGRAHV